MEKMQEEIKKHLPDNYFARLNKMQSDLNNHAAVVELRVQFPNHTVVDNDLYQYSRSKDNCSNCTGLGKCHNLPKGHEIVAVESPLLNGSLNFIFKPCSLLKASDRKVKIQSLIKSHFVPDHVINSSFEQLEKDPARKEVITEAMRFCVTYKPGVYKGLYLQGPLGVGKSSIAGAMCQELAKRDVDVLMVYVPDFLGEIKNAIKTNEVESKLDALRTVSVLILDDIGAEPLTTWTRDEILGPILQRRMERLPIIYTSNLSLSELKEHFTKTKDEREPSPMKAARLMDRIEPFVNVVKVGGRNRRR